MTDAFLFVLLTLSSYRLWRIVGKDEWPPSRRLRERIEAKVAHHAGQQSIFETGARTSRADYLAFRSHRRSHTFWDELQTMLTCSWCLGTWTAGAVVVIVAQIYSVPIPVLQWLAVSCGVGLIGSTLDDG